MKVLHLTSTYFPDPVGGEEIFVRSLAATLAASGVEPVLCAPGATAQSYRHGGLQVHRFAGRQADWLLESWYDEGDPIAAGSFAEVLSLEEPDVVHVHTHSVEVSLRLAREVKARRIPLVFTYHAATVSCETGGLMRWGESPCDGRMDAARCASCNLAKLGMPRQMASLVGRAPPAMGRIIEKCGLRGRAWTALRMNELLGRKHAAARAFLEIADVIVAPSRWVAAVLEENAIPAAKVTLCGQGMAGGRPGPRRDIASAPPLRLVTLARLDRVKGLHVLIEALAANRDLDIRLDIFGVRWPGDPGYEERVARAIARDPRLRLHGAIAHEEVLDVLARYHALAVPSQVMETGPLVVLEAFAAGIPVIGSALGGIQERVADGRNGLLVPAADRRAWTSALSRLASDPALLGRLAEGITPPPRIEDVAASMQGIYRSLVPASAAVARPGGRSMPESLSPQCTVTVAMVTCNAQAFVAEAIESVLAQDFGDFELLVCDDASTDGTWELITRYTDPRVRAIRNPINIGEYPNRNQALALARGKYLIYIDGDDLLYPQGLRIMADALDRFAHAAFASAQPPSDKFIYPLELTPREFYACQFLGPNITAMNFTQLLFRVESLRAAGGFDPAYRSGDTHIQYVLALTQRCVLIANGLAWWRHRPGQASEALRRNAWGSAEFARYCRDLLEDRRCPLSPEEKRIANANLDRPLLRTVVRFMLRGRVLHAWRLLRLSGVSPRRWGHLFSRDRRPYLADGEHALER